MAKADLTAQRLREVLHYDPETGVFTWCAVNTNRVKVGGIAGYACHNGYWRISVDDRLYFAHRLAWLYVMGRWPKEQIDHIDRDTSNNKFANLRELSNSENQRNKAQRKNKLGSVGVHRSRRKYRAVLVLGTFDTQEEASAAYQSARATLGI